MSSSDKNKLLIENPVISTLHFNKRMEKMFKYFQTKDAFNPYKMEDYFFRIEFQARGSPHLHSLIYLQEDYIEEREEKIRNIEKCAKLLLSASVNDIYCEDCENVNVDGNISSCEQCKVLRDRVKGNNTHKCGFSCHKKKKQITIKAKEGHGRLD